VMKTCQLLVKWWHWKVNISAQCRVITKNSNCCDVEFEIGNVVWAKVGKNPHWPALVTEPWSPRPSHSTYLLCTCIDCENWKERVKKARFSQLLCIQWPFVSPQTDRQMDRQTLNLKIWSDLHLRTQARTWSHTTKRTEKVLFRNAMKSWRGEKTW
jgi:hypothetical protein